MLYFTYKIEFSDTDDYIREMNAPDHQIDWRVGDPIPREQIESRIIITSCYADGAELDYIIGSFHNLPHTALGETKRKPCVWRGSFSQFIWDNM
jgi:hypothetical protein